MITIRQAIETYKQSFYAHGGLDDEKYKWEMLTNLYHLPNLEEKDFSIEVKKLKYGNLVYGPQLTAVRNFALYKPEEYRAALRILFDETTELQQRVGHFIVTCEALWEEIKVNFDKETSAMCDERLISAMLACYYPEKYTFYKNDVYKLLCRMTGEAPLQKGHKLTHFYTLLNNAVIPEVEKETKLLDDIKTELEAAHFKQSLPLVAQTILWCYMLNMSNKKNTKAIPNEQIPRKPSIWLFSPGEKASKWQECIDKGIMSIDWAEMGDLQQYTTLSDLKETAKTVYKGSSSLGMSGLCMWEFVHAMQPGDIVLAKDGRRKIVGRGTVTSDYKYDGNRSDYPNYREVKWKILGEWPTKDMPIKTLTCLDGYPDLATTLMKLIDGQVSPVSSDNRSAQSWWLVANQKQFSISDMKVGDAVKWTLYNANGMKRRVFQHFLNARKGDLVIGYESTPVLQIVAILEVAEEANDECIVFRKTESLHAPIDFADFKDLAELKNMEFIKNHMGSLFKLTADEYEVLMELIREQNPLESSQETMEKYDKERFLQEVYMSSESYDRLSQLLLRKKNVILQGAPGVGKTFTAKRLAYAMLGAKDKNRVKMVQFHQNYSYEDFIMGFKPNENGGFSLKKGVFYNFCKRSKADSNNKYFFIIDEINRGNLSKIFGELLMLIENDYRNHPIKMAYNGEEFSVPDNLYIIGMMNTADRSLAMIDYALRRRFSFFEMEPGFASDGFKAYQTQLNSEAFNRVISGIVQLNDVIKNDESLGNGFCIGHSYFCGQQTYNSLWLKNVIDYDITPMLQEYWFDNPKQSKLQINLLKNKIG